MQEADSLAAVRTDLFSHEAAGADRAAVQLRNCISQCGPVVIQTGTITKQHGFWNHTTRCRKNDQIHDATSLCLTDGPGISTRAFVWAWL